MSSANSMRRSVVCTVLATAAMACPAFAGAPTPASVLQLTSPTFQPAPVTGTSLGFSLQLFASGLGSYGNDPTLQGAAGVAVDPFGRVYVTDIGGAIYTFPNRTDGQVVGGPNTTSDFTYGFQDYTGITQENGNIYFATNGAQQLIQSNTSGQAVTTLWPGTWNLSKDVATNPNTTMTYGTDPVHPRVFVSLGHWTDFSTTPNPTFHAGTIEYIDPAQAALGNNAHPGTGQFITSNSSVDPDSLVMNASGTEIYTMWSDNVIRRFSTAMDPTTDLPVADFANPDWSMSGLNGSLALGTGAFAGDLFVGTNGGVDMIDIATQQLIAVIASGNGFTGYLTADPFDGSLYVGYSQSVYRLTAPAGTDGSGNANGFLAASEPVTAVPEPASLALLGIGGFSILAMRGKRKSK